MEVGVGELVGVALAVGVGVADGVRATVAAKTTSGRVSVISFWLWSGVGPPWPWQLAMNVMAAMKTRSRRITRDHNHTFGFGAVSFTGIRDLLSAKNRIA